MFIYPETKLRCDSCQWKGERKELFYRKETKQEHCPTCDEPLVSTESNKPVLIKRNATALSH